MLTERKSVMSEVNRKISEVVAEITDAPVDIQPLTEMIISEALAAEMNMNADPTSPDEILEEELIEDKDDEIDDDEEENEMTEDDEEIVEVMDGIDPSQGLLAEDEQLTQVIEDAVQSAIENALVETGEEDEEKRGMHIRKPRRSKQRSARKQTMLLDMLIKRLAEQDKAREVVIKAALDNQQAVRALAEQVEQLQQQMKTMAKQLAMRPRASVSPETVVSKDAARQMGVDENYVIDPVFGKLRAQP